MLHSQAHCQVAQKTHRQNLNLSISLPAPTQKKRPAANKKYNACRSFFFTEKESTLSK